MSSGGGGSGNYYKHPCKNLYSYDCKNWVWVANSACIACVAAGRDDEGMPSSGSRHAARDFLTPQLQHDFLQDAAIESVLPTETGAGAALHEEDIY